MAKLFAGTSGFAYPQWKPDFYPQKLAAKKFLEYYAGRLNAVEINYTFRRNPSAGTIEGWVNATPPHFSFCLKAHMRNMGAFDPKTLPPPVGGTLRDEIEITAPAELAKPVRRASVAAAPPRSP